MSDFRRRRRSRFAFRRAGSAIAMTVALAGSARAQDFSLPRATPLSGAAAPIEDALPPANSGFVLAVGSIAWYGVRELGTRAVVAGAGWRGLRAALGLSQTGDAALGWTTLALGLGATGPDWGVGARVLARRDRTSAFDFDPAPGEGGLEGGAGAWLRLGSTVTAWATAPGLATTGAEPPLSRPLEAGVEWRGSELTLWLARRSAPPAYGSATLVAGVATRSGPACVWLAAHDAPLVGSLGFALTIATVGVQAEVESHPWLAPTTRLAVVLAGPP